jgi:hypothetical protein
MIQLIQLSMEAIMSRFLVTALVAAAMAAAISSSASAYFCVASSPNGAIGTAGALFLGRAQMFAMRRCVLRGGGAGCQLACRPY